MGWSIEQVREVAELLTIQHDKIDLQFRIFKTDAAAKQGTTVKIPVVKPNFHHNVNQAFGIQSVTPPPAYFPASKMTRLPVRTSERFGLNK